MATLQQIRDAIKATMDAVPGVGIVHNRERYIESLADFKTLFVTGAELKGWIIRRTGFRVTSSALGRDTVVNRWRIDGWAGFDDAASSELAFDNLIEEIRAAFRADESLGGVVAGTVIDGEAGIQLDDSGPVMFAKVLCHSARLRLATRHYE